MPKKAPTTDPAASPAAGAQRRSLPPPFRWIPAAVATVTQAHRGPAAAGAPAGKSSSMRKRMGMTVTGRSMITVPVTTGVRMRCSRARRSENAACTSPDTTTSVASRDTPP